MEKHPYMSPLDIYNRLTDPTPLVREPSEAMALGTFFEPYIAKYASQKLGLRLRAGRDTIQHRVSNLCATPDYYVVGKPMLVEIKLSSKMYVWSEETLQPYILWQARAQMAVTNRDTCIIAALVGSTFHEVYVVRDMREEVRMLNAVDAFWYDHVIAGKAPAEPDTRITKVSIKK